MMNDAEKKALISALGRVIADEVKRGLEPLRLELASLTLKLEHAELRCREMRYAGTWNAQSKFKKGNFVTHNGSLWACQIDDVATVPGHDHDAWTLAVKSMARA